MLGKTIRQSEGKAGMIIGTLAAHLGCKTTRNATKTVKVSFYMNVCARREQKPSLLGLCRAAANFRASECRAELVRAMPSAAENVKKRCIYMNEIARHITAKDYEHARIDRRGY